MNKCQLPTLVGLGALRRATRNGELQNACSQRSRLYMVLSSYTAYIGAFTPLATKPARCQPFKMFLFKQEDVARCIFLRPC